MTPWVGRGGAGTEQAEVIRIISARAAEDDGLSLGLSGWKLRHQQACAGRFRRLLGRKRR